VRSPDRSTMPAAEKLNLGILGNRQG
jgi:hypothetical protein